MKLPKNAVKPRKRLFSQLLSKIKDSKAKEPKGKLAFGPKDQELFVDLEKRIASNIGAFLRLGEALSIIQERNLQRISDPQLTFDEYCSRRWGFGKAYAYRLIKGYACVINLEKVLKPHGVQTFPTNEAQVRPLTSLKPEQQVNAWVKVLEKANGKGITAVLVDNIAYGQTVKPSRQYRVSVNEEVVAKAGLKKLQAIAGIVDKALKVDPSERSINQLSKVLMRIQGLLKAKS